MVIFFPQSSQACSALAGTPPRGPRYRKQCSNPENLCGRFSLPAARDSPTNRERDNKSNKPHQFSIFDFGFPIVGTENEEIEGKIFASSIFFSLWPPIAANAFPDGAMCHDAPPPCLATSLSLIFITLFGMTSAFVVIPRRSRGISHLI